MRTIYEEGSNEALRGWRSAYYFIGGFWLVVGLIVVSVVVFVWLRGGPVPPGPRSISWAGLVYLLLFGSFWAAGVFFLTGLQVAGVRVTDEGIVFPVPVPVDVIARGGSAVRYSEIVRVHRSPETVPDRWKQVREGRAWVKTSYGWATMDPGDWLVERRRRRPHLLDASTIADRGAFLEAVRPFVDWGGG